jgi:hypothetical protein
VKGSIYIWCKWCLGKYHQSPPPTPHHLHPLPVYCRRPCTVHQGGAPFLFHSPPRANGHRMRRQQHEADRTGR